MARTKNRHIPQSEIGTKVIKAAEKTYIAGIYTRLSQERKEDYRDKSNSLEMQEELCIKTANEKDIKILEHIRIMSIPERILKDRHFLK